MGEGALGARRRRTHPNYEKDKRAPVSKIETKDDDMDMDTGRVRINNRINRYTRTRTG